MNEARDLEIQMAISNMLSDLEKQIKEPLTENQQRIIFRTIFLCLTHLAHNKQNITEHR